MQQLKVPIKQLLEKHGYTWTIDRRQPYQGCPGGEHVQVVTAAKDGIHAIATCGEPGQYRALERALSGLPYVSKLLEVIGDDSGPEIALFEKAEGDLLWHLESERPHSSLIRGQLTEYLHAAREAGVVHADLRPWNILYCDGKVKIIDWDFGFMANGTKYGRTDDHLQERGHAGRDALDIDAVDVDRTLEALQSPHHVEELWHHPRSSFTWRPTRWSQY